MKDKLRQNHDSCNSKTLKQTYQSAVKMAASAPKTMNGFDGHVVDRESRGALPLTKSTKFWITVVSIFGVLYETNGTSVYSTEDVAKSTVVRVIEKQH